MEIAVSVIFHNTFVKEAVGVHIGNRNFFKNDYSLESVSYIKADNLQADNYEGLKQITVDEENINSDEVITTYDMPKYSLCILHLKQIGR